MKKICKKCNFDNGDDVNFCGNCGCDLTEEPQSIDSKKSQINDSMRKKEEVYNNLRKQFKFTIVMFLIVLIISIIFLCVYRDFSFLFILVFFSFELVVMFFRYGLAGIINYHTDEALNDIYDKKTLFCTNCGNEIKNNATSCNKCGIIIKKSKNDIKNLSFLPYGILAMGIIIGRVAKNVFVLFISGGLSYIIGLITIIVLKIKYPNEKSINVSLIIYGIITLLLIGVSIVLIGICNSCQGLSG